MKKWKLTAKVLIEVRNSGETKAEALAGGVTQLRDVILKAIPTATIVVTAASVTEDK